MSRKKVFVSIAVILTVAIMAFALTACISSDLDKVEKKLDKAGYEVEVQKIDDDDKEAGVVGILEAGKVDSIGDAFGAISGNADGITVVVFATAKEAKEYYNDHKDDIETLAKFFKDGKSGVQGKIIYVGSPDAIKAAK
ncbi:MAG: hypothetical protein LBT55_06155 [Clostridiaceae bacterium]|jgi:hypothetical protein|nr:hypothetical protein [Clostridiaceae bacterium]